MSSVALTDRSREVLPAREKPAVRVVLVVDEALSIGYAANSAAVLAVTLGARVGGLPGPDLLDADGGVHLGLIPIGLPVLKAPAAALKAMRDRAARLPEVTVVDFPVQGQQTTDYVAFQAMVAATPAANLTYLGVALHGPRAAINKLVGSFSLLR
jgi:hypothetical protein